MKKAFITGIGGQDGYFLTKLLIQKGYCVYGLEFSKLSTGNFLLLTNEEKKHTKLFFGDICDKKLIEKILKKYKFDEIYHLAGQTSIHPSLKNPDLAYRDNIDSVIHLLEAIKKYSPRTKFFLAASAELFGDRPFAVPQNEKTPFFPRNPYGFSKLAAFWLVKYYRENYKIFSCSGILFNHESEMRGEQFVTRKISMGVAKIYAGKQKQIVLGDISAKRDWGYAEDYVEAMWKMLQYKKPDDYVIATGKSHSVKDFVDEAFNCVGIKLLWIKRGIFLLAKNPKTKDVIVKADLSDENNNMRKKFLLVGDSYKARKVLKWKPKIDFKKIVKIMVTADMKILSNKK